MRCQNCSVEVIGTPSFCSNCGAGLHALSVQPLGRGFETERTGPFDETVFVPTFDERGEGRPIADLSPNVFEDAAADDEFEQSLSGVRLEDVTEDEPAEEEKTGDAHQSNGPEPIELQPALARVEANLQAAVDQETERPLKPGTAPSYRGSFAGRLLRPTLLLFAGAGLFIGGFATAMWQLAPSESDIPVVEPVVTASERRVPAAPPGMVYVPGGEFTMGIEEGDKYSRPAHRMSVGAFYIDRTEVTNAMYQQFVTATRNDPPAGWANGHFPAGTADLPVTGVSWYDAAEYAAWAGKRLPTEAEWELAARGTDGRIYPWGNEWDASMANARGADGLRAVGQGGRSPYGVFDMSGNAWEWTASDARPYPGGPEIPWSRLRLKIIRGGNWQSPPEKATTVFRGFYGAAGEREYNGTGFRCVMDIPKY